MLTIVPLFVCVLALGEPPVSSAPAEPALDEVADRIAELGGEDFEAAVAALAALGKPAVSPLVETLRTAELDVAWQAARALRALGKDASGGKAKLTTFAGDGSVGAGKRAIACFALGGLGSAASTAAGTLVENLSGEASELQLLAAIALVELGKPSVSPLGKAVKEPDDLFAAAWAVAALANLGADAKGAAPSLERVVADEAHGRESPFFALRRAARGILDELEVAYEPAVEKSELYRDALAEKDAAFHIFRGGRLDAALREDPSRLRALLSSDLGFGEEEIAELPIALPERFEDCDGDEHLTASELIQALVAHLVVALGPLARAVSAGEFATHEAWQRSAAPLVGLSFVVRVLSTPEFLARSSALRVVMGGWDGLFPPEGSRPFFFEQ